MASRSLFLTAAAAALTMAVAQSPEQIGRWDIVTANSVHMALLPEDRLLLTERIHVLPEDQYNPEILAKLRTNGFYGPNKNLGDFLTDTAEYELKNKSFTLKDYIPKAEDLGKREGHAFCSGAAQMADGNILVAGGDQFWWKPFKGTNVTSDGRRDVRVYTPGQNFAKVAELFYEGGPNGNTTFSGRWYPTAVAMPDEKVMIIGGHRVYYKPDDPLANNPTYEVYDPAAKQLAAPVDVPMLHETFPINMYPITYVLPQSGKIWSLAGNKSVIIDPANGGQTASASLPNDGILPRSFPFAGTNFMTALTPKNKYQATIWLCGGVDGTTAQREGTAWYANCPKCLATKRCYQINPEANGQTFQAEDMLLPRSQPLAVNLPDGKVAIIGGTGRGHQGGNAGTPQNWDPVNKVVLFNPTKPVGDAQRWVAGAEATVPRQYHGTALLRTDGTVVTGGDDEQNYLDIPGADPYELRLEVYSPPYMFLPNRPSLDLNTAPKQLKYDQAFIVPFTSDVGPKISSVSLIRYSTVTHTLNVDQRHVELEIVKYGKNKVLVRSPPNANIAVPGNWMLWAVDNRGAPVVQAATVNIRAGNQGEDAVWDEKETVQADKETKAVQSLQNNAGFVSQRSWSALVLSVVACMITVM
ncbi:hypothetical protein SpCBS45565_g07649 [Spizellomyces sp. 'palustris']|nr:hypothetical protein SpCBS45565_g07649 [Spizellomyces sp. 'palustris']